MDVITRAGTHLVVTHLDYFTDTDAKVSENRKRKYFQTAEKLGLVDGESCCCYGEATKLLGIWAKLFKNQNNAIKLFVPNKDFRIKCARRVYAIRRSVSNKALCHLFFLSVPSIIIESTAMNT